MYMSCIMIIYDSITVTELSQLHVCGSYSHSYAVNHSICVCVCVCQGWGRLQRHDYNFNYDYTMITKNDYD